MSRPAVFRALAALADAGVVELPVTEDSGAGRPAARSVPVECGHVTGVDIGPHELFVTVADPAGAVLAERRVVTLLGAAEVTVVRPSAASSRSALLLSPLTPTSTTWLPGALPSRSAPSPSGLKCAGVGARTALPDESSSGPIAVRRLTRLPLGLLGVVGYPVQGGGGAAAGGHRGAYISLDAVAHHGP